MCSSGSIASESKFVFAVGIVNFNSILIHRIASFLFASTFHGQKPLVKRLNAWLRLRSSNRL